MAADDIFASNDPSTRRKRWAWITIAGVGIASAATLFAVPALADSSPSPARDGGRIVVCESGVIDHGDGVQTSSAATVTLPDGFHGQLPAGCHGG